MFSGRSRSRFDRPFSRPTAFGRSVAMAAAGIFLAALTSGVNLLYLVDGTLWAVLVVALVGGRRRIRPIVVDVVLPDSIFAAAPFVLDLRLRNTGKRPAFQVAVLTSGAGRTIPVLPGRSEAGLAVPYVCPERGRVRLNDLWVESGFPFGIFRHHRSLEAPEAVVFPRLREITGRPASPFVREDSVLRPVRGVGDDFTGIREYAEDEDARLIHWTLSAKTGVPVLKQYARETGNRITLTVGDPDGPGAEAMIEEAASLARFFIDEDAEVRLVTPERTIDHGRGILHLGLILGTLAGLGRGGGPRDVRPGAHPFALPAPEPSPRASGYAAAATATAFASLFLIEDAAAGPLLAAGAALLGGMLAARFRLPPIPGRVLDAAGVVFLGYFLAVDIPRHGVLASVIHLVSFILVSIVWGGRGKRFFGRLLLAGFLAFLISSSQALSLAYFPFFAVYFLSAGAWILRRQDPENAPASPQWRRALVGTMAAAASLAVLAFVLWPRPFNPGLQRLLARSGLLRFQAGFRTFGGMTERVELGTWDSLRRNTAPAMRVTIEGMNGGVRPSFIRVRGAAFDLFDGRRWRRTRPEFRYRLADRSLRARYSQAWFRRERGRLVAPGYEDSPAARVTGFFLYPVLNTNLVFSLGRVGVVESSMSGAFFDANDSAYFSTAYPEGLRYRILSRPETPPFSGMIEDYDHLLSRFLAVPAPDEEIRRLAAAVTRGRDGPLRKAEAIADHLQTAFTYSNAAGSGRQSLRAFLFDSRAGNCEYFATAMCILLRHIGIPSRLVIGFVSDAWNAYGGFFDVRQSDAHAWVEAYIDGRGWTTFDPTPSDAMGAGPPSLLGQIWRSAGGFFEALQFRWYRYVVGFDTFTQRDFWLGLAARISRLLLPLLGAVALLAALILGGRFWRLPGRGRRLVFRRSSGEGSYETVLRHLARAGLPRPPWRTGRDYSAEVIARFPRLSVLAELTELRYARRFASRPPSSGTDAAESALAAALKREIRAVRRILRRDRRGRNGMKTA